MERYSRKSLGWLRKEEEVQDNHKPPGRSISQPISTLLFSLPKKMLVVDQNCSAQLIE